MVRFVFALASLGAASELGESLASSFGGDKMERQFVFYNKLPVGEDALKAAGWTKHDGNGCDPALGFGWTEDESGVTKRKPMKLYTTAGGQPSGVGVVILSYYNEAPLPGSQQQWVTQEPRVPGVEGTHIDVAFRSGAIMCSGAVDSDKIGNTLIVNPKGMSKHIALTEDGVRSDGWHRGSCFDGMGWHNFLDTSLGNGQMSWKAENLFPVTTMYHEGKLNAIFFTSTIDQVSIPVVATNGWEPKSLTDSEMCQNTCDSDCHFDGLTSAGPFSTMHIYFNDHTEVKCEEGLTCAANIPGSGNAGCCASKAAMEV